MKKTPLYALLSIFVISACAELGIPDLTKEKTWDDLSYTFSDPIETGHTADGTIIQIKNGQAIDAMAGSPLNGYLNDYDLKNVLNALSFAVQEAPVGHRIGWENPENGRMGSAVILSDVSVGDKVCRDYNVDYVNDIDIIVDNGKVCSEDNGTWIIHR